MKKLLTCLAMLVFATTYAQNSAEIEIRKLEDAQRQAFLKKDTTTLFKLFSPNFVVNAPTNKITTLQELMQLMRQGAVDMEVFERITEMVTFNKNIAIAMGNGTAACKAVSDYVTGDVDAGGIAQALKHFELI